MYFKDFILFIFLFLNVFIDSECLNEYKKLEIKDCPSVNRRDLPDEFSSEAYNTIDDFIKKTHDLEYECALYFDYKSGQILKCEMGRINEVKIDFIEGEFENNHVASIHNHPKSVFSPPSGKNFGILTRDFEDYELISAPNELWILKAKCNSKRLMIEFNIASLELFELALNQANLMYQSIEMVNDACDLIYGSFLLKYINDKNINHIQLIKRSYKYDY